VLDALPEKLPASADPVILKKRTLLRRTFPDDQMKSQRGNSNNQLWHQDSNAKFNDHPMLTLWITLQDTLGGVRPSLEFIDAEVAYFSPDHGDYSAVLPEYLAGLFPRARTRQIFAAAGDCILFNGLTFHKTFTTENTTLHRDALLVRVVDRITARDFSPEYSDEDVLRVD
jgi:ectoine hydroxylase-related dioxygenase (phytanoyl-CoA dioxygenase family)